MRNFDIENVLCKLYDVFHCVVTHNTTHKKSIQNTITKRWMPLMYTFFINRFNFWKLICVTRLNPAEWNESIRHSLSEQEYCFNQIPHLLELSTVNLAHMSHEFHLFYTVRFGVWKDSTSGKNSLEYERGNYCFRSILKFRSLHW